MRSQRLSGEATFKKVAQRQAICGQTIDRATWSDPWQKTEAAYCESVATSPPVRVETDCQMLMSMLLATAPDRAVHQRGIYNTRMVAPRGDRRVGRKRGAFALSRPDDIDVVIGAIESAHHPGYSAGT